MVAAAERTEPAADVAARRRGPTEPAPDTTPGSAPGSTEVATTGRRPAATMNPRSMAMLQRSAGNAAVAGLLRGRSGAPASRGAPVSSVGVGSTVGSSGRSGSSGSSSVDAPVPSATESDQLPVQRLAPGAAGGSTAPPVPPPAADPASDPKFRAVTGTVKSAGVALRKHPPATAEVGKAQAAAKGPPDDKAGQAKAAQADAMAAAKPGGFDKAAFIAAVRKAIADAAPKTLDDADKFAESGKADGVKSQVMSQVTTGRDASVKNVKDEAGRTPDAAAGKDKPVTPLAAEPAAATPKVDGAAAMPGPAPAEQVTFTGGPAQVDQQLADAQVTEQHLAKSNEPQLQEAAAAKKGAEAHAATAPAAIRAHESAALGEAKAGAGADSAAAMAGMGRDKAGALARVAGAKTDTKSKDEVERARISGEINKIFDQTKADVEVILNGIDGKVNAEFDKGEAAARGAFTAKHKADMEKYKDDRYSGITGAARWTADLFSGLPDEANRIYDAAKALYESQMTAVISTVADLIGRELDAAKARVDKGRAQIKAFIASQPAALRKLAGEAAKDVGGKFDQLDADVDAKQQSLVDDLASKYTEARGKVDEEIKAEQEKNKGLVDKAKEAIGGAIDTILKLKALFTGLLAKAASAFTKILEDPVAFISNFMSAVKQGFLSFAGNILTHLKKGLLGWLFGALASAGIELPDSFDLKGILKLVGSILGLTWTNIKARIAKLAPWAAAAIDVIESKIEIFTILATQGIAGLWNWIKEKLGDLKSMILTPIMDFVKEKIITAGISWVIGMLNPAGALVKIVQALVGVVQWIMERGAALMDFVGTVIDSVTDIANGGVGGVPAKIEAALGKAVPLVIAFLANLLGLGGISDKIKSILKAVQAPINKALDAVIKGALKLAGPLIRGIQGIGATVKAKAAAGKAWLKGKLSPAGAQPTSGRTAAEKPFNAGGVAHRVYVDAGAPGSRAMVASSPQPIESFLSSVLAAMAANKFGTGRKQRDRFTSAEQSQVRSIASQIRQLMLTMDRPGSDRAEGPVDRSASIGLISQLVTDIVQIVGTGGAANTAELEREQGKSVSFAKYEIAGPARRSAGNLVSLSGEIPRVQPDAAGSEVQPGMNQFFQTLRIRGSHTLEPAGSTNPAHRFHDSELKLLEAIAASLTPERTSTDSAPGALRFPEFSGSVHLSSDFVTCASCAFAIGQFRRVFPNVTLIAQSNERLSFAEERKQAALIRSRLN